MDNEEALKLMNTAQQALDRINGYLTLLEAQVEEITRLKSRIKELEKGIWKTIDPENTKETILVQRWYLDALIKDHPDKGDR